jgi:hypothetical protein
MVRLMGVAVAAVALGLGLALSPAQAVTVNVGFANVTGNLPDLPAGQLNVEVTDSPAGSVSFKFTNAVGTPSSITDIYFSVAPGILESLPFTISQSFGVDFSYGATPANLPGGFNTTQSLSADSNPPVSDNGINSASEWLTVTLALVAGKDIYDLSGNIQIGLHVQSINGGNSDSYVSNPVVINRTVSEVPLPAGVWLFGTALAGLGALKLKRRRRQALSAA